MRKEKKKTQRKGKENEGKGKEGKERTGEEREGTGRRGGKEKDNRRGLVFIGSEMKSPDIPKPFTEILPSA